MSSRAVIVLAYQEEEGIAQTISTLQRAQRAGVIDRILVVDDGSTDDTTRIAREKGIEVLSLRENRGKAYGFCAGAFYFSRKNPPQMIAVLDADLEPFTPAQLNKLFEPLERNPKQKMAIGSVRIGGAPIKPEYSGERAIRFAGLAPLFKGNMKWLQYFGLRAASGKPNQYVMSERIGYGLEGALDRLLIPLGRKPESVQVDCGFVSLRTESRFGRNIMHAEIHAPRVIAQKRMDLARRLIEIRKKSKDGPAHARRVWGDLHQTTRFTRKK